MAKVLRGVVEPQLLVDTGNFLHVLLLELEVAPQVLLDASRGLALRDHRVALRNTPGKSNLRAGLVVLLADLVENRVVDQLADGGAIDLVLVSKRRVVRDVDW